MLVLLSSFHVDLGDPASPGGCSPAFTKEPLPNRTLFLCKCRGKGITLATVVFSA